jgi:DNA-directed RNA polymerase specialized sigma24 family protein
MRVTQHVLVSERRRRSSQKRGGRQRLVSLEEVLETPVTSQEEDQFNEAWAQAIIREGLQRLRRDTARMKLAYHDALVLRYFEHRSQSEIAARLACTEHDVENYLRYGKERLRRILRDLTQEYCSSETEHFEELKLLQRYGS